MDENKNLPKRRRSDQSSAARLGRRTTDENYRAPAGRRNIDKPAAKAAAVRKPAGNYYAGRRTSDRAADTRDGRRAATDAPVHNFRRAPMPPVIKNAPEPEPPERIRKLLRLENFFFSWDTSFLITVIILLGFGIIVMFSASYNIAFREYGNGSFFFNRQLVFALIGLAAMALFSAVDYRIWKTKPMVILLSLMSVALMFMVKAGFGVTQGSAERWLSIFGITFQPSELTKFTVIILLALWGAKAKPEQPVRVKYRGGSHLYYLYLKCICMPVRYGFGFAVVTLCLACGLTVIQPHLSATIIIGVIGMAIIFVSGASKSNIMKFITVLVIGAICAILLMKVMGYTYIDKRILSLMNPEADKDDSTFQTYNSLLAIGSGGFWGVGLGKSHQKYGFLPASQNDFIFSVLCEELGFVGAAFVVILFAIFIGRGLFIAFKSRDKFGMLLAVGIVIQMGFQAFLNIAVASNAFFNTGISLPFFSYGGSALVMQLAQIGILLNVSRYSEVD